MQRRSTLSANFVLAADGRRHGRRQLELRAYPGTAAQTTVTPTETSGTPVSSSSDQFNAFGIAPRYVRVGDVAHVFDGAEVQRASYSYDR